MIGPLSNTTYRSSGLKPTTLDIDRLDPIFTR
jgi:hypothetical protein